MQEKNCWKSQCTHTRGREGERVFEGVWGAAGVMSYGGGAVGIVGTDACSDSSFDDDGRGSSYNIPVLWAIQCHCVGDVLIIVHT